MGEIPEITEEQREEMGLFVGTADKVVGKPVKVRMGLNLITREATGEVAVWFRYFSPEQVEDRRRWSRAVCDDFRKNSVMGRWTS